MSSADQNQFEICLDQFQKKVEAFCEEKKTWKALDYQVLTQHDQDIVEAFISVIESDFSNSFGDRANQNAASIKKSFDAYFNLRNTIFLELEDSIKRSPRSAFFFQYPFVSICQRLKPAVKKGTEKSHTFKPILNELKLVFVPRRPRSDSDSATSEVFLRKLNSRAQEVNGLNSLENLYFKPFLISLSLQQTWKFLFKGYFNIDSAFSSDDVLEIQKIMLNLVTSFPSENHLKHLIEASLEVISSPEEAAKVFFSCRKLRDFETFIPTIIPGSKTISAQNIFGLKNFLKEDRETHSYRILNLYLPFLSDFRKVKDKSIPLLALMYLNNLSTMEKEALFNERISYFLEAREPRKSLKAELESAYLFEGGKLRRATHPAKKAVNFYLGSTETALRPYHSKEELLHEKYWLVYENHFVQDVSEIRPSKFTPHRSQELKRLISSLLKTDSNPLKSGGASESSSRESFSFFEELQKLFEFFSMNLQDEDYPDLRSDFLKIFHQYFFENEEIRAALTNSAWQEKTKVFLQQYAGTIFEIGHEAHKVSRLREFTDWLLLLKAEQCQPILSDMKAKLSGLKMSSLKRLIDEMPLIVTPPSSKKKDVEEDANSGFQRSQFRSAWFQIILNVMAQTRNFQREMIDWVSHLEIKRLSSQKSGEVLALNEKLCLIIGWLWMNAKRFPDVIKWLEETYRHRLDESPYSQLMKAFLSNTKMEPSASLLERLFGANEEEIFEIIQEVTSKLDKKFSDKPSVLQLRRLQGEKSEETTEKLKKCFVGLFGSFEMNMSLAISALLWRFSVEPFAKVSEPSKTDSSENETKLELPPPSLERPPVAPAAGERQSTAGIGAGEDEEKRTPSDAREMTRRKPKPKVNQEMFEWLRTRLSPQDLEKIAQNYEHLNPYSNSNPLKSLWFSENLELLPSCFSKQVETLEAYDDSPKPSLGPLELLNPKIIQLFGCLNRQTEFQLISFRNEMVKIFGSFEGSWLHWELNELAQNLREAENIHGFFKVIKSHISEKKETLLEGDGPSRIKSFSDLFDSLVSAGNVPTTAMGELSSDPRSVIYVMWGLCQLLHYRTPTESLLRSKLPPLISKAERDFPPLDALPKVFDYLCKQGKTLIHFRAPFEKLNALNADFLQRGVKSWNQKKFEGVIDQAWETGNYFSVYFFWNLAELQSFDLKSSMNTKVGPLELEPFSEELSKLPLLDQAAFYALKEKAVEPSVLFSEMRTRLPLECLKEISEDLHLKALIHRDFVDLQKELGKASSHHEQLLILLEHAFIQEEKGGLEKEPLKWLSKARGRVLQSYFAGRESDKPNAENLRKPLFSLGVFAIFVPEDHQLRKLTSEPGVAPVFQGVQASVLYASGASAGAGSAAMVEMHRLGSLN